MLHLGGWGAPLSKGKVLGLLGRGVKEWVRSFEEALGEGGESGGRTGSKNQKHCRKSPAFTKALKEDEG